MASIDPSDLGHDETESDGEKSNNSFVMQLKYRRELRAKFSYVLNKRVSLRPFVNQYYETIGMKQIRLKGC